MLDDCIIEGTADADLYQELAFEANIRVELVVKNALDLYKQEGADVVEIYSPPRIAQESSVKAYGVPGSSRDGAGASRETILRLVSHGI